MAAIRVGFGEEFQPAFPNGLPDVVFQSAPPAKGAMQLQLRPGKQPVVSIRAPREGGDHPPTTNRASRCRFNPRPPRRGRFSPSRLSISQRMFQSAPPAKGAMVAEWNAHKLDVVSIRAPREGGDWVRRGIG